MVRMAALLTCLISCRKPSIVDIKFSKDANLTQHQTDDVILYIYSIHKHRGNSVNLQDYKMRLKGIRLNWINSMQLEKVIFTNVFFSWLLCLLNMF
jgi:hypothetical protein